MNGEVTTVAEDCNAGVIMPWVVDVRPEKNPVTIATFPIPKPPANAPYSDFCFKGRRFGPHDTQNFKAPGEARKKSWPMPGSTRVIVCMTCQIRFIRSKSPILYRRWETSGAASNEGLSSGTGN
jgi:hypothetical protein